MPHKRVKRSAREKIRVQSGLNIAPGSRHAIDNEEIPKSAARILNAAKTQEDYRKRKLIENGESVGPTRKRRRSDGHGDGQTASEARKKIRIQPGESMAYFNRRVEDSMRHEVHVAMTQSSAVAWTRRKEDAKKTYKSSREATSTPSHAREQDDTRTEPDKSKTLATAPSTARRRPENFERLSTSTPRRLNDIVQAPPQLKKFPRGAQQRKKSSDLAIATAEAATTLKHGALSMAQKAMLEEERERAVTLYREMKKAKLSG